MDIQRMAKQLRREAKANPKKAALLGGLAAIGVYFWAPLVVGWVAPEKKSPAAVNSVPIAAGSENGTAAIAPLREKSPGKEKTREDNKSWRETWAAMQQDGRRKSTTLVSRDNPFNPNRSRTSAVAPTAKTDVTKAAAPVAVEEEVDANVPTPESLGMKLTATMITSSQRLAVINGDVIAEGGLIVVGEGGERANTAISEKKTDKEQGSKANGKNAANGGDASAPRFRVVKVDADFVLLERLGKLYPLRLDTPRLQTKSTLRVAL